MGSQESTESLDQPREFARWLFQHAGDVALIATPVIFTIGWMQLSLTALTVGVTIGDLGVQVHDILLVGTVYGAPLALGVLFALARLRVRIWSGTLLIGLTAIAVLPSWSLWLVLVLVVLAIAWCTLVLVRNNSDGFRSTLPHIGLAVVCASVGTMAVADWSLYLDRSDGRRSPLALQAVLSPREVWIELEPDSDMLQFVAQDGPREEPLICAMRLGESVFIVAGGTLVVDEPVMVAGTPQCSRIPGLD